MSSHDKGISDIKREDSIIAKEQGEVFCLPSTFVKDKVDTSASFETDQINQHERLCACGCVPVGMLSLFEMAELRRKYREKLKQSNQCG